MSSWVKSLNHMYIYIHIYIYALRAANAVALYYLYYDNLDDVDYNVEALNLAKLFIKICNFFLFLFLLLFYKFSFIYIKYMFFILIYACVCAINNNNIIIIIKKNREIFRVLLYHNYCYITLLNNN